MLQLTSGKNDYKNARMINMQADMSNTEVTSAEVTQESKNMALLLWIGTIFLGFIPGLVLFLVKKDDAYVSAQSKEALNWSITEILGYVVATVLTFVVIGAFLFPVIGICHVVFCILGAIKTSKGEQFQVPFAIRLIK